MFASFEQYQCSLLHFLNSCICIWGLRLLLWHMNQFCINLYLVNETSVASVRSDSWSCLTQSARCLSTFLRSSAAAKTGRWTAGLPSSVINQKKSAFVDSVGVKRTCSSGASDKLEHSQEAKPAYWLAMFAWLGPSKVPGYVLVNCLVNIG